MPAAEFVALSVILSISEVLTFLSVSFIFMSATEGSIVSIAKYQW